MMRFRTVFTLALLLLVCGTLVAQVDAFKRAKLFTPPRDSVGWGEAVAGVDFDGDSKTEIYAVNTNYYDAAPELIPRIYKYELDGTTWNMVWSATLDIPLQNTWPALTYGDLDGDGKMEIIWGPVNFLDATTNPKPARIVVFEHAGGSSDNLGVSDGAGGWRPNAKWVIDTTNMYNLRPFRWVATDVDGDGKQEVVFCDRAGAWKGGVISVSDIPDNGEGSETWTIEWSGKGITTLPAGTYYDVAVLDSSVFFFTTSGHVQALLWRAGAYTLKSTYQSNLIPSGSWKSSMVVDINGDATKEIVIAGNANGGQPNDIFLLQLQADTLKATKLTTTALNLGGGRTFGGGYGDIDNDGKLDFVFASRASVPTGIITRMSYKGGAIDDPANYAFTTIDQGFGAGGERYDFVRLFNADADVDLEILYGMGYGGNWDVPMVLLDRLTLPAAPLTIAAARVDANADFVPDSLGRTVTVIGTVTSNNQLGSSTQFYHYIQDATAGILAFKSGLTAPVVSYPIGNRIAVTGSIAQYNGLDEIVPTSMTTDVIDMGPDYRPAAAKELTIEQYLANGEMYESQLIKFAGVAKKAGSAAWPAAGSSSNMTIWDGFASTTMRISSYSQVDDSAEVTYPVNVVGIATQFDGTAPYDAGYQIIPRLYSDFTQKVATKPNAKSIKLWSPANGSEFVLNDSSQTLTFGWSPAVDLDGDTLVYQWAPIGLTAKSTGNGGKDTTYSIKGQELLVTYLGTKDTLELKWRVAAKDPANPAVFGVDTFKVTVVKGAIVVVENSENLPLEFDLAQNYPNPFNPSTTIRVALPMQAFVTLKIYNLLGEEVATLVNEERSAGYLNLEWNGRNRLGQQAASGVYLYRVVAKATDGSSDFVSSKKMLLLK